MSPRMSRQQREGDGDVDFKRIALFTGSLVFVLLTAPMVYRITMRLIEQDHKQLINSNLLAFIVTSTFCIVLLLLTNSYFDRFANYLNNDCQQLQASHKPAFITKLMAMFTTRPRQANFAGDDKRSPFHTNGFGAGAQDASSKRKIDAKYFKPKFIIHELMTFWGTTCTVITWGSFYIIGGTVVMSEKLAQKIKAKSSRSPARDGSSSFVFPDRHNASWSATGTGQSDFSFSSAFGPAQPAAAEGSTRKPPFQRISSWTRRSVQSVKKKFSRTTRTSCPQLTTGPANDSSSNIFFFGTTTDTANA